MMCIIVEMRDGNVNVTAFSALNLRLDLMMFVVLSDGDESRAIYCHTMTAVYMLLDSSFLHSLFHRFLPTHPK